MHRWKYSTSLYMGYGNQVTAKAWVLLVLSCTYIRILLWIHMYFPIHVINDVILYLNDFFHFITFLVIGLFIDSNSTTIHNLSFWDDYFPKRKFKNWLKLNDFVKWCFLGVEVGCCLVVIFPCSNYSYSAVS